MALINCSECRKQISDKAISCPNCGNPINKASINVVGKHALLKFPILPTELEIGKKRKHCIFRGFYDGNENKNTRLPISGNVYVLGHVNGIRILTPERKDSTFYEIHNSQIISLKQTTLNELSKIEKSVIGRAVAGGLILGPIGAIIGGISGIGTKQKIKDKHYLVINYWEIETKSIQTLLISGRKIQIPSFIKIYNGDEENVKGIREASPEGWTRDNTYGLIVLIVIIAIAILIIYKLLIQ